MGSGILAIRYQSYLFHYGAGLWSGVLASISAMLGITCANRAKPAWYCGGQYWQMPIFVASVMLSLAAAVVLSIFSTSGLLQDAKTTMGIVSQ